jgi:RNA polymerase sigma-70 factor (ECF subfamily)
MQQTDSQLVKEYCQHGNLRAAGELVDRHAPSVHRFLWQMLRQQQDCEDASQETFRKVLRALPQYEEKERFAAWVFRIARNEALAMLRKRGRFVSDETETGSRAERIAAPNPNGAEHAALREEVQIVETAISELPPAEKEVVLLRLRENLGFREIAEITESPLNTVLGRMHRARQKLKRAIEPIETLLS